MSVLPLDLTEIIHEELRRDRRPNDGLLHASSHLTGSLRHAQLDVVGAPKVSSELLSEITLKTGTMWHEWIHNTLRRLGVPYMAEVNMNPWLPDGWGGTLDALIWNPELKAFVLRDFKTQKGEGIRYIIRDGAKAEHIAQTSAYWHAAKAMGIPLARLIEVYYLPKNDTRSKDDMVEPVLVDFQPLPAKSLHLEMERRSARVTEYRSELDKYIGGRSAPDSLEGWLRPSLDPVQEREQKVYFDKKTGIHEVKLVPHWSAAYCPFPTELCDCSEQGTTKIGFVDITGEYYPRPGFDDIVPDPKLLDAARESRSG